MPGSHSVGSLFVNIGGSSKGLKKALGNAKKDLSSFASSIPGMGGGAVAGARANLQRANARKAALDEYGRRGPGRVKSSRQQFGKEMARTVGEQGAAKTELSRAMAARNMMIGFGVLGVTVGAVSALLKRGLGSGQQSIQKHMQFGAIGPQGARFVEAQVEALLAQLSHAESPKGSEVLAKEAERAIRWDEVGRKWEVLADRFGDAIIAFAEFVSPKNEVTVQSSQRAARDRATAGGNRGGFGVG